MNGWRPSPAAVRLALGLTLALRLGLAVWGGVVASLVPTAVNEAVRPYLGAPRLTTGVTGLLLGPWQRFDTNHYVRLAAQGYGVANEADSVFPPLYPGLMRLVGSVIPGERHTAYLIAGLLISTVAYGVALAYLYDWVDGRWPGAAPRTLLYLTLFPTSFFFMGGYAESLFLLWVVLCLVAATRGKLAWAGWWGFLAALTRLTGWVLAVVLLYRFWQLYALQRRPRRGTLADMLGVAAPGLGLVLFMVGRWWLGLPSLTAVYGAYWHQITAFPGYDLVTGVRMALAGTLTRSAFTLALDYGCVLLLVVATWYSWRRLGWVAGIYQSLMLFFILLPASDLKPLYSFSRYTLLFWPLFVMVAQWGDGRWRQRLILYPAIVLLLFLSGQFFMWGWVA